jgi:hypothetical protein
VTSVPDPRSSLENEIGPKRECPRMAVANSRKAAKECSPRRKPWVGPERDQPWRGGRQCRIRAATSFSILSSALANATL